MNYCYFYKIFISHLLSIKYVLLKLSFEILILSIVLNFLFLSIILYKNNKLNPKHVFKNNTIYSVPEFHVSFPFNPT